jgi:hypothetical protein
MIMDIFLVMFLVIILIIIAFIMFKISKQLSRLNGYLRIQNVILIDNHAGENYKIHSSILNIAKNGVGINKHGLGKSHKEELREIAREYDESNLYDEIEDFMSEEEFERKKRIHELEQKKASYLDKDI